MLYHPSDIIKELFHCLYRSTPSLSSTPREIFTIGKLKEVINSSSPFSYNKEKKECFEKHFDQSKTNVEHLLEADSSLSTGAKTLTPTPKMLELLATNGYTLQKRNLKRMYRREFKTILGYPDNFLIFSYKGDFLIFDPMDVEKPDHQKAVITHIKEMEEAFVDSLLKKKDGSRIYYRYGNSQEDLNNNLLNFVDMDTEDVFFRIYIKALKAVPSKSSHARIKYKFLQYVLPILVEDPIPYLDHTLPALKDIAKCMMQDPTCADKGIDFVNNKLKTWGLQ